LANTWLPQYPMNWVEFRVRTQSQASSSEAVNTRWESYVSCRENAHVSHVPAPSTTKELSPAISTASMTLSWSRSMAVLTGSSSVVMDDRENTTWRQSSSAAVTSVNTRAEA